MYISQINLTWNAKGYVRTRRLLMKADTCLHVLEEHLTHIEDWENCVQREEKRIEDFSKYNDDLFTLAEFRLRTQRNHQARPTITNSHANTRIACRESDLRLSVSKLLEEKSSQLPLTQ